jgi:hypothetical protein
LTDTALEGIEPPLHLVELPSELDAADERDHRHEQHDEGDEAEQPEHWRPLSRRTIG